MKAVIFAALNPLDELNVDGAGKFEFNSAWLWLVLIIAGTFIGYLCVDAWLCRLREKRMNAWRKQAKH